MAARNTGSCVTIMKVAPGNQVGIMWVPRSDGRVIGFVYDEDVLPKGQVYEMAHVYCQQAGLAELASEFGDGMREAATYEEISQDVFLARFGDVPRAVGVYYDEGGSVGGVSATFGPVPKSSLGAHEKAHGSMMRSALVSTGIVCLVVLAAILVLVLVSWLLSARAGVPVIESLVTILGVILMFLGVVSLFVGIGYLSRFVYAKVHGSGR